MELIESLYVEFPAIDFVLIELTKELQKKFSQSEIKKICELFSSNNQTPIIVVDYEEN